MEDATLCNTLEFFGRLETLYPSRSVCQRGDGGVGGLVSLSARDFAHTTEAKTRVESSADRCLQPSRACLSTATEDFCSAAQPTPPAEPCRSRKHSQSQAAESAESAAPNAEALVEALGTPKHHHRASAEAARRTKTPNARWASTCDETCTCALDDRERAASS